MSTDPVLGELSDLLAKATTEETFSATLRRVQRALAAESDCPQAWEPIPLEVFGSTLPSSIKSCWVFVLRAGGMFGAERHPNSHQRTVALSGSARFEVLEDGVWAPRPVDATNAGERTRRSISIPANTWHRITIGPDTFVSCSFHSVPAHELIEETPVDKDLSVTRRRLYHA
jgi:hypothetical protein